MFPSADEGAKLTIIWVNPLQCGAVHAKHMQTYLSNRPAVLLWPDAEIKKKRGEHCVLDRRGVNLQKHPCIQPPCSLLSAHSQDKCILIMMRLI